MKNRLLLAALFVAICCLSSCINNGSTGELIEDTSQQQNNDSLETLRSQYDFDEKYFTFYDDGVLTFSSDYTFDSGTPRLNINLGIPSTYMGAKIKEFRVKNGHAYCPFPKVFVDDGIQSVRFGSTGVLENLCLPKTIKEIELNHSPNLKTVHLAEGVTEISANSFYSCESLTTVTIPNSVTTIGSSAFWYCISLTSINIPDNLLSIGERAFEGCHQLSKIVLGQRVQRVESMAFNDCCEYCSFVVIPASVTYIGDSAFGYLDNNYSSYPNIYYKGNKEQWLNIEGKNGFSRLDIVYFYSESEPTESGNYWHYVKGQPTVW